MSVRHCPPAEHARRDATTSAVLDEKLASAAAMLSAASDRGRLRMLLLLGQGPAFVSVLARELGVRLSLASQQLAVLREARLVRARRRGKSVEYSLVDEHVHSLIESCLAIVRRMKR